MRRLLYVLIGTFLFAAGTAQAQVDRASLTGTRWNSGWPRWYGCAAA